MLPPNGYWPLPPVATPSWPGGTVAPSDLTWMRDIQSAAQPEASAVVSRPTLTPDGYGGQTKTYATVTTTTARISPANSAREARLAEQLGAISLWRLTLPHLTDVLHADRIVVNGRTFNVVLVDSHSWGTATVAICMELS